MCTGNLVTADRGELNTTKLKRSCEAKDVYHDRSKWKAVVPAYPAMGKIHEVYVYVYEEITTYNLSIDTHGTEAMSRVT